MEQVFVTGRPEHVSYQMELEGGKRWYSGYIAPWGKDGDGRELVLFLARDETQRKRTEEAMLQAQKLESLGVLAGGIAHDFNNLLVGVLGYAELLHQQLPLEGKAAQHLRSIITSAQKAAALCQQLLAYAGKGTLTPRLLNLNALIDELAPLLRPSLAKNVELHQELATDLPPFMGDASQINQVIMNLLVNASEATADTGGRIVVGTSVEVLTGEEIHGLHQADAVVPGPHVRLEVRDTGPGMDRDTLEKVFDPFFSTKFAGRGLGLAAVSGVVRAHRGGLRVESVPGVGTVFHVLLPVGTVQASPEAPPREPAGRNRGGGPPGEVLVVDDEEMIRSLAREALEDAGWRVRVARHGKEAWELLQEHGDGLGAVVLDLTLPGMDGLEVLGLLRRRWPHLPVVLMSGYNEAAARERGYDAQGVVFLEKPFSPLLLVSVLCDLVAGTG